MAIKPNIAVRFSDPDKEALREVARRFCGGNQSETLRTLVREAYAVLLEHDSRVPLGTIRPVSMAAGEGELAP